MEYSVEKRSICGEWHQVYIEDVEPGDVIRFRDKETKSIEEQEGESEFYVVSKPYIKDGADIVDVRSWSHVKREFFISRQGEQSGIGVGADGQGLSEDQGM